MVCVGILEVGKCLVFAVLRNKLLSAGAGHPWGWLAVRQPSDVCE